MKQPATPEPELLNGIETERKELTMSKMCTNESCKAKKGMCSHEKMMTGMMIVIVIAAATFWMI